MTLKLVFPTEEYEKEWKEIIEEIESVKETMVPHALKKDANDYAEYLEIVRRYSKGVDIPADRVPSDIFFLVNEGDKKILGAIDIRYELTEYLLRYGGHIGYGIRPRSRKKGYASEMLRLALDICREKGLKKVLITCDKNNLGSARTMINNGAVLENEIENGEEITQRYWIEL